MSGLWSKFRSFFNKSHHKKVICVILATLLLLIPSFSALVYVYLTDNTITFSGSEKLSVELTTSDGRVIASEEASSEFMSASSLAGMLQQLNDTKIKSTRKVSELNDRPWLRASFTTAESSFGLSLYFSFSANDSYCVDDSGQVYRISQDLCDRFFATRYTESFYSNATVPTLATAGGEAILPTSLSWKYKNASSAFTEALLNETVQEQISYDMPGALSLSFAEEPDECTVLVYNKNEKLVYKGNHHDLQSFVGSSAHVKVTALWNQKEGSSFFGSATYDFMARIRDRAVFSVNTDTVRAGDAVLLTCTNITELKQLSFAESRENPFKLVSKPVFYQVGGVAKAWVVIPKSATDGSFRFTVSYGASSKTIALNVTSSQEIGFYTLSKDSDQIPPLPFDKMEEQIKSIAKDLSAPSGDSLYFPGDFVRPTERGFTKGYSYLDTVFTADHAFSFLSYGTEYRLPSSGSDAIEAVHSGVVIRTGNSILLGSYVIVDHGLGLRTWYCHLGILDVKAGDLVASGQSIGKAMPHSTSSANGFLLMCTIESAFVDPEFLFTE